MKVFPSLHIFLRVLTASFGFSPTMKFFEKPMMFCLISEAAIPAVKPVAAPDRRVFATPVNCDSPERKYSLMCCESCCVVVRVGRTSMKRKRGP